MENQDKITIGCMKLDIESKNTEIADLKELLDRYKGGYKGSCYACEPVGILNQKLEAEKAALINQNDAQGHRIAELKADSIEEMLLNVNHFWVENKTEVVNLKDIENYIVKQLRGKAND